MFYPQAKATSPGQIKETKYIDNSERSDCDHYRVRDAISWLGLKAMSTCACIESVCLLVSFSCHFYVHLEYNRCGVYNAWGPIKTRMPPMNTASECSSARHIIWGQMEMYSHAISNFCTSSSSIETSISTWCKYKKYLWYAVHKFPFLYTLGVHIHIPVPAKL